MTDNEKNAQTLINNLLKRADGDTEFKAWKAAHPEREAELATMTREEKIQEIFRLLEELGIIPPEPQKDDAAEAENT